MKARTILLMRHGTTRPGAGKRLIGRYDEELDERGLETARQRAGEFAGRGLQTVVTSALRRSADMGKIISAALCVPLHIEPGLNEIDLGEWDGMLIDEVKERWPEAFRERGENMLTFRPPGGENFYDLQTRVEEALARTLKTAAGNLLIIAHRSVNRVILAGALELPLEKMSTLPQPYGGFYVLRQAGDILTAPQMPAEQH